MMKSLMPILILFFIGRLHAQTFDSENSTCNHALLEINRSLPLDAIPKSTEILKVEDRIPQAPVIGPFKQRRKVSRVLYQSGLLTSPVFSDIINKILGTYADLIINQNSKNRDAYPIPYEDLARSMYSELLNRYFSANFKLSEAQKILSQKGKTHFDLSTIDLIKNSWRGSYEETPEELSARAVVLANALIDIGEEGVVLTLKELTMHVLGSVLEYHQSRVQNTKLVNFLDKKANSISERMNTNLKKGADGSRFWIGMGLGLATAITGFVNIEVSTFMTVSEVFGATYLAGFQGPKLDFYTVYLSEKLAQLGQTTRSWMQSQAIKDRIEHQLQDSTKTGKNSWLHWFSSNEERSNAPAETAYQGTSEILTRIASDINYLHNATTELDLSIQRVRKFHSTRVEIGKLEQVVDRTQEIMAVTLMTFQNDLDFGTLSLFPDLIKELSKVRNQKSISALEPKIQALLSQLNQEYLVIEALRNQIKMLVSTIQTHLQILTRPEAGPDVTDIVESMVSSQRILENIQGNLMIAQQNMNFLKLNLSTLSEISNFKKIHQLTDRLLQSFNDISNSLPAYQICLTGVTDQCLMPNQRRAIND